jgi:hypothetical protein
MVFVPSSNWWNGGGEQYLIVGNNWQHPGVNYDSVRRWVAAQAGTVHVTGAVSRPDPNGDGVLVTIKHNGLPIWQSDIPPAGTGIPFDLTESVAIGDSLDFVVNKKGDNSYDSTTFDPTIVLSSTFTSPTVATPTISPNGGNYTGSVLMTLQTVTVGALIYYTTDGSTPTQSSTLYSGAITLTSGAIIKAIAFKSGYNLSGEANAMFTIVPNTGALTLTWQDNSTNEDVFQIERKLEPGGLYIQIASVTANFNFYVDTDSVSGTRYCYRVRAVNSSEISAYTNEACATAP